jgi:transcriptional regulator with XRE-family HTH domain
MHEELGPRLKAHRVARGLTLRQLAERVGVAFQTLDAWESGRAAVTWDRLQAWADAMGVDAILVLQPRARGEGLSSVPLTSAQADLRAAIEACCGEVPDDAARAMARWIRLEAAAGLGSSAGGGQKPV